MDTSIPFPGGQRPCEPCGFPENDCNNNGVYDALDIHVNSTSLDLNHNAIPDECEFCEPCDMNCEPPVNALDIEFFIGLLFDNTDPCCGNRGEVGSTGDVNGDGSITAADIEGFINCLFP